MTALPTVGNINYPSAEEVRDNALRTIKVDLARAGIAVNVLPGSEPYARANAWARRAVVAFANNRIRYQDLSPLTATGDNLITVCGLFGVRPRPSSKSAGFVRIISSGTVTIPAGYVAIAPNGESYETITVATVASLGLVELRSINSGKATRQTVNTKLTWQSASVSALNPFCVVAAGEIDGGNDEDTQETLRRRLLDRLRNPAVDDNVARVRQLAEDASAAVYKAYAYQAVRGPSTIDVAVVSEDGDRSLSPANLAIVAGSLAALPGHADVNITTVVAEPLDVVLLGTLPLPQAAGGAGGGWVDGTPWPSGTPVAGTNDGKVTAYSAGVATVRATTSPTIGRQIGIWDPVAKIMHEYTIASVGGVSGAYTITVQGLDGSVGFKVNPAGAFVSAGAANLSRYATTFLSLMAPGLGPGEKTDSTDVLPRGGRRPSVSGTELRDLDNRLLGALMQAHPELDVSYGLRLATGTTTAQSSPSIPAAPLLPPRILTLKHFAIWKA